MLWVLQNNFYSEAGYVRLVEGIERLGLPHVIVKPVPFTHRLLPADADTSTSAVVVESIPEAVIDTTQPIFPMGSYTLARIGQQRGWSPGAQLANLDYPSWANAWGAGRLLNPGARIAKFINAADPLEIRLQKLRCRYGPLTVTPGTNLIVVLGSGL